MKRLFLAIAALALALTTKAADSYTVTIAYNGTSATVSIPSAITNYVSCSSGTSSHVKLTQKSTDTDNPGEIIYSLSGSSTDGELYLEGSYKLTLLLNGVTLTNPDSAAIRVQDGKRIKVSLASGTTSSLTDGANEQSNGCFHCKGHTEFRGKGTLNITGNSKHGVYSKEYVEVKNCTLNITTAPKDGIHCKEYFLMESGTVSISNAGDDGIQVELSDDEATGTTTDHEDENSGNFYMTGGTLNISLLDNGGKYVKADGDISYASGATTSFTTLTGIRNVEQDSSFTIEEADQVYDLQGRKVAGKLRKGVYIIKKGNSCVKVFTGE